MPKTHFDRSGTDLSDVFGSTVRAKKKIKSIEGLLQRDDLPADVRIEKERALKALRVDLKARRFELQTQKRAKKYHMVRFFERKKATRKLKQATKAHADAVASEVKKDAKKAKKVLKHAQIDVAYVIMFPKAAKYVSLYPTGPSSAEVDDENVKKGMRLTEEKRASYRKEMEQLIDSGKLPFSFDDVLAGKHVEVNTTAPARAEEIDAPEAAKENDIEEDDFFE